ARRPVSVKDMEHIADRVEYVIQKRGRAEFHSHAIGDVVVEELRQLDEVAYIRYAIVYLGLDDLEAIRKEIDAIREQRR
ncbi:MAG: ATP cone domain-containing protein, partial [Chloroflexota bacterium]|nr:ATP cone domain-containing protein [Chloroflexota bacterium]